MESQKKVLVVDNDEVVLVLIDHILTRHSYAVLTTADAAHAEKLLETEPYDCVLLDLKMPHGGVDMIRRIESKDPNQLRKVVVVTGALDEAAKIAGLPLHAIVRKPFEVGSLVDIVKSCVERNDHRGEG